MMQPLALTQLALVSCLGAGQAAILTALQAGRSGLAPCAFDVATLHTYTGTVDSVDEYQLPESFLEFNCRNNRLAALALAQDGLMAAVAAAREKYGPKRIGLFLGTSTSGIFETEIAYRQRDTAGKQPAEQFQLRRDAQHVFHRRFRAALSTARRPGAGCVVGLRLDYQGVRQCGADDRDGAVRCSDCRRSR